MTAQTEMGAKWRAIIARMAWHASSRTTGVISRRELRPVITTGAEIMDEIFGSKRRRGSTATAAG